MTDNICNVNSFPSRRTLAHAINNELIFARIKLFVIPRESFRAASQEKLIEYFDNISVYFARREIDVMGMLLLVNEQWK